MKFEDKPFADRLHPPACLTVAILMCWGVAARCEDQALPAVTVTATPTTEVVINKKRGLAERQAASTDTTDLLRGQPGFSMYGAGGLSGLPVLRGMADDRLRVRVNGMDPQSACPNHMNAPLSYIAPSDVSSLTVQAGVTPVSAGGDSLGGSIDVRGAPPVFAAQGEPPVTEGEVRAFLRSNGQVRGASARAAWGGEAWSLSYSGSTAQARNYHAAQPFKAAEPGTEGGSPVPGDEVASSAYHYLNHDFGVALRLDHHLLKLNVGDQHVFSEGYPNQRMDMTDNQNQSVNLRYEGEYEWGELNARLSTQRTRHAMDMGTDRYQYGTGMPMLTRADTDSGELSASIPLGEIDTIKTGAEYLRYTLYDWWPPVGGSMGPQTFWNIDNGRRNRLGAYAEWSRNWHPQWQSTIGLRRERVETNASDVQGYNNGLAAAWGDDAAAFNAREHRHVDQNWDLSAQLSHQPSARSSLDLGYARKTRSPNLYQRYPWSTNSMAALMNNFVGDGNGYIGREDLRPEVAQTLSVAGQWRAAEPQAWQIKANAYVTHIDDYIDAQRCDFGQCGAANLSNQTRFVLLQYANQSARIEGMDISGKGMMVHSEAWGRFDLQGVLNLLRGANLDTHQPLYNMMPANATLSLTQQLERWAHTLEWQLVAGKHQVSGVRNEIPTAGYSLLNWRSNLAWSKARLDLGIDNLLDRFYRPPLGGAYLGQGNSMASNVIPWGQVVPGPGRSFTAALTLLY